MRREALLNPPIAQFRPASWFTLLVEVEARTAEQRDRDRIADIAWREFESWDPRYLAEAK